MNVTCVALRKIVRLANQGYVYVRTTDKKITLSKGDEKASVDTYGRVHFEKDNGAAK